MLFNLFEALRLLPASRTPQLLTVLVACGATLFLSGNATLDALAFAVQRLVLIALLAPLAGAALTTASLVAWAAMLVLMVIPVLQESLRRRHSITSCDTIWLRPPLTLRALVAVAAVVLVPVLIRRIQPLGLSLGVAWAICWLLVSALLRWVLWRSPMHAGWSGVMLSDAGRLLYALWQPDIWVWSLWSICDVVLLAVASYLGSPQQTLGPDIPSGEPW